MIPVHRDGNASPTLSRNRYRGNSCSLSSPHNIADGKLIHSSQFYTSTCLPSSSRYISNRRYEVPASFFRQLQSYSNTQIVQNADGRLLFNSLSASILVGPRLPMPRLLPILTSVRSRTILQSNRLLTLLSRPVVVRTSLVVAPDHNDHPEPPHHTSNDAICDFALDRIATKL